MWLIVCYPKPVADPGSSFLGLGWNLSIGQRRVSGAFPGRRAGDVGEGSGPDENGLQVWILFAKSIPHGTLSSSRAASK